MSKCSQSCCTRTNINLIPPSKPLYLVPGPPYNPRPYYTEEVRAENAQPFGRVGNAGPFDRAETIPPKESEMVERSSIFDLSSEINRAEEKKTD